MNPHYEFLLLAQARQRERHTVALRRVVETAFARSIELRERAQSSSRRAEDRGGVRAAGVRSQPACRTVE